MEEESYPSIEIGGDLSQANGGVAADGTLIIFRLQSCKVTQELLVQVGFIQLGSQQKHRLQRGKQT